MIKVIYDFLVFEDMINVYFFKMIFFIMVMGFDFFVFDVDYIFFVLWRVGDGVREWWGGIFFVVRRFELVSVDLIRNFINNDMRVLWE